MLLLITLLFFSTSSYVFLALLLRGNIQQPPRSATPWEPVVSVIVAAKNEESYLRDCLTSLAQLDYPSEKLDIIIVDDASTDGSGEIIKNFTTDPRFSSLRLEHDQKEKSGKAGALLAGFEKSCGEIVFMTDADCQVPPAWIQTMLHGFGERIGIVGGFTLVNKPKTLFEKVQALDWLYLLSVASAASQLNKPITWVGNNLAVRRQAYDNVGGYRKLDDSFVEDFALINAIEHQTTWQCRFYASPDSAVRTRAAASLRQFYAQRKRWSLGISSARPFGMWVMLSGFLTHLLLFVVAPFSWQTALWTALAKMLVDYLVFHPSRKILQEPCPWPFFLLYELFYIVYTALLPILLLFDRHISWKGAEMRRD